MLQTNIIKNNKFTGQLIKRQIVFTIPIAPVPKARHRTTIQGGRVHNYNDPKAQGDIETFIAYARPAAPREPLDGALAFRVGVYLPIPQSWSRKKHAAAIAGTQWPEASRQDLDNFIKFASDCMNGLFFVDDRQIVSIESVKKYSETPRWEIQVIQI